MHNGSFFLKKLINFLVVLGFHCCAGFSLVVARGVYSLEQCTGLLIVVASGFSRCRAQALGVQASVVENMGSVVSAPGL